jgi:hypothetical protein
MRIILTPDDMGDQSYQLILPALTVVDQVVVWRPSLHKIDSLHAIGKIEFSAQQFFQLIEKGFVVVGGRHDWFADESGRKSVSYWSGSPWTKLDSSLKTIKRNDERIAFALRRAISLDPGQGEVWARRQLEVGYKDLQLAREILASRSVPPGFMRLLDAAETEDDKLKILLRHARNLSMIESETHCDLSLQPFSYIQEIATIGAKPRNLKENKTIKEREALARGVEILKRLSKFKNFGDWTEFLESAERREFSRAFAPYLTTVQAIEDFSSELESQVGMLSWGEAIKPDAWAAITFVVSLGISVASNPLATLAGISGLAVSAVQLAPKLPRKLNLTEIDEAKKVRWAFMLRGNAKVTERGFNKLMRDLRSERK